MLTAEALEARSGCALRGVGSVEKLPCLVPAGEGSGFLRSHTGSGSGGVLQVDVLAQTHKGGKGSSC